ncbi:MAG TPA: molybdopterin-dependent oxidoreductase, partial [Steroidobacteraceae bacterium]|nr:molybdopterin-dependent oxidoreductase [Steroidobacteraceae bacterium]
EVDGLEALFLIGANLRAEIPMLAHRVRKAALRGARVSLLQPAPFEYLFPVAQSLTISPAQMVSQLAGIVQAALSSTGAAASPALAPLLTGVSVNESHRAIATSLGTGRRAIWLGALALRHSAYAELRLLARELAQLTGATLGELLEGANGTGAYLAGCVPHRDPAGQVRAASGMNVREMLERPLRGYLLLGTEPWADGAPSQALVTLENAPFVVALTAYASPAMLEVAQVLLPAAAFAETSGTYVNLEGRWQSFGGAARAPGAARPGWKILRVLGNLLDLDNFDYQSSEQVRDELRAAVEQGPSRTYAGTFSAVLSSKVESLRDTPMYQIDPVLRRATALQLTRMGLEPAREYRS